MVNRSNSFTVAIPPCVRVCALLRAFLERVTRRFRGFRKIQEREVTRVEIYLPGIVIQAGVAV